MSTKKKVKKGATGVPRPMPAWFADAMRTAMLEDFIRALPWYRRAWLHILAIFKADIPQWAVPPGWGVRPASPGSEGKR